MVADDGLAAGDVNRGAATPLATRDGPVPTSAGAVVRTLAFPRSLHPILVHYTIALTSSSLVFDLLGRVLRQRELVTTGWWTLALGVAATMLTLVTGVTARRRLDIGEGTARSYLRLHMALGPAFFGMLLATAIWRAWLWSAREPPGWWYLAALAATCGVMAVQGYAGGELVYRWGADVGGRARGLRQGHATEPPPALRTASAAGMDG